MSHTTYFRSLVTTILGESMDSTVTDKLNSWQSERDYGTYLHQTNRRQAEYHRYSQGRNATTERTILSLLLQCSPFVYRKLYGSSRASLVSLIAQSSCAELSLLQGLDFQMIFSSFSLLLKNTTFVHRAARLPHPLPSPTYYGYEIPSYADCF